MSICLCVCVVNMCLFGPPTLVGLGPIKSVSSVRPSVCLSVCNTLFSELAHRFFLIFCMKLGVHKGSKVTEPNFWKKISFAQIWAKRAQNGPKMEFLVFSQKSIPLMCTFYCEKWIVLLAFIILWKPHVWETSGSWDIGQKGQKWAGQLGKSGPK